jgi:TolB-like protein/Tfp pilus assembly protein PilF
LRHFRDLLAELRRRRVIRALVVWGVVAFAVLQVYEPVMHGLHLPEWTLSFVVVLLGLGFPVTLALSWTFDLTASGIERTPTAAATSLRGTRLALLLAGLGLLAALPGLGWVLLRAERAPAAPTATPAPVAAPGVPAVATPATPSIAVLPFADMSEKHDQEYFADGVAEEILNALAHVEGLKVIGRTSSFAFKGKNEDLRAIGQKLDVAHVLEGSMRKSGGRIRVTAQLIKVTDGSHLWSESYDRTLDDIFKVQDEIARSVTDALKARLLGAARPAPGSRTGSPEAYRELLVGRHVQNQGTDESMRQAIEALRRAVVLDPGYASAWAGLADALFEYADRMGASEAEIRSLEREALQAAEKAVTLGPDVGDSWCVRGSLRMSIQWDWDGARSDLDRALALAPGDAATRRRRGGLLSALGRTREALAEDERAVELDPLSVTAWESLAYDRLAAGDLPGARQAVDRTLEIEPGTPVGIRRLGEIHLLAGKPADALAVFQRLPIEYARLTGVAMAQHALGNASASNQALQVLETRMADTAALQVAQVHAWRGERDLALDWLGRALRQRDTGLRRVKADVYLTPLHGDPRWKALLAKMKLPVD